MLTDKELLELISKLDVITIAVHRTDVAHIGLIGRPREVFALEKHVLEVSILRRKAEDEAISTVTV